MGNRWQFKVCLLGDGGVGKTSLKNRYVHGEFTNKYLTTLGVDFASHSAKLDNGDEAVIQIWDVAGQDAFSSIRNSYFQGAKGGLVVFDVTRPETLENLAETWVGPFFKALNEKPPIIVIGNKADLSAERVIKVETGQKLIERLKEQFELSYNIIYIETSAKDGTGLQCFELLANQVISYIKNPS